MSRYTTAALAAILACSTAAFAQQGQDEALGAERARQSLRINVDVEDTDLVEVMEQIGQKVERNILVDPNVSETVTVSLHNIGWREAVEVIAKMTRCEVEERGDVLLLTQPPKVTIQFQDANVRTVLQLLAAYSGKNIIISPQVTGEVTLDLKEVHWLRALHAIVKTSGDYEVVEDGEELLRVVPRSAIERQLETVVFKLKHARPPAAYRAIPPSSTGTGAGGGGASNQASASVFIGQVQTTAAANIRDTFTLFRSLQAVVTSSQIPGATLEYDEQTNSFIVTATAPLLNQLREIIKTVDKRPSQIYTEVKFVATTDNNNQNYGFEFGEGLTDQGLRWSNQQHGPFVQGQTFNYLAGSDRNSGYGFFGNTASPGNFTPIHTSLGPDQQGLITQTQFDISPGRMPFMVGEGLSEFARNFRIPAMLNLGEFNMVLNLLDRDSRTRTIQSPSLFMLDNQDAVIFVGDQVPYATFSTAQDANGNIQATIREGSRSPVAIGFSLFIQPHVVPGEDENSVTMTIIPRVNDLVGTTSTIPGFERFSFGFNNTQIDLPRTREQALVTHVMLEDTQTAVLGGLLTEIDTEVIKRIPILSSLPILGNLFTNTQTNKRLENLTIFVTPTIIRQRRTVDSIFIRASKRLEDADYFYQKYEKAKQDEDQASEEEDD